MGDNENCAGELLERCIVSENFVCVNDGFQTRRNSESVIDLFIVKPHLNRSISRCIILTHESVTSDHIGILMEIVDTDSEDFDTTEWYHIHKTDWENWDDVTSENFSKWIQDVKKKEIEIQALKSTVIHFQEYSRSAWTKVFLKENQNVQIGELWLHGIMKM